MRILVLDGSRILPSLVRRLGPSDLEVETAATFDEAVARLETDPPEAVMANLTPADLPWRDLATLCRDREPPIPMIFESCIHSNPEEAGLGPLDDRDSFLTKPYCMDELRCQIERLVDSVRDMAGKTATFAGSPSRRR